MNIEAKDTVMNPQEQMSQAVLDNMELPMGQAIAKVQAEITWKAREPEIAEARKAGMQEVVEWIEPRIAVNEFGIMQTNIDFVEWQAQLKRWGIE